MIKHLYIVIALLCATSQQCSAMEKPSLQEKTYPAVITSLTKQDKQQFKSALWVDNTTVALLTTDGCSLYNTATNKEVTQLFNKPTYPTALQCIFMSRNKKHLGIIHD